MGQPFLITGLPRSRTAWFALLANMAPRTVCYHEPTADSESFDEMLDLWEATDWDYIGISDSTLGFQIGRILRDVKPRVLVIERPIEDVRKSLVAYLSGLEISMPRIDAYLTSLLASITENIAHPSIHRVGFEELRDEGNVRDALAWILPGAEVRSLDLIMRMNVQVDRDYAISKAKIPHNHWYRCAA